MVIELVLLFAFAFAIGVAIVKVVDAGRISAGIARSKNGGDRSI
jgi:hypothetical protein